MRCITGGQEDDDFHGGVFKLVDAQPAQMIREMDHTLDARAEPESASLFQRDGLAVRNADFAWRRHRPETAGEQQQLAPRIDQQRDLIINLRHNVSIRPEKRKNTNYESIHPRNDFKSTSNLPGCF